MRSYCRAGLLVCARAVTWVVGLALAGPRACRPCVWWRRNGLLGAVVALQAAASDPRWCVVDAGAMLGHLVHFK